MDISKFIDKISLENIKENKKLIEELNDFKLREKIYYYIHNNFNTKYNKLIYFMADIEYNERLEDTYMEYDLFYFSIFLIYRLKKVSDIFLIWEYKYTDFDSSFGVEGEFLLSTGYENTILYLNNIKDNTLKDTKEDILKYLTESYNDGAFRDKDIEQWYESRCSYFNNFHSAFIKEYK